MQSCKTCKSYKSCSYLYMKFDIFVFIVSTYMILVRVPILCNSVWIEQNDKYRFKGSEAKAIMI